MKKIITVILLLMMFITGYAQRIVVYKQLDESLIKVSAGKSSVSCPLKPSDSAPLKHSTMPP